MSDEKIIRQYLIISGRVQGVGFRYRANYTATALGLTGWVKNEWDGTVHMEVQGTLDCINKMLEQISKGTYVYIDGITRKNLSIDEEERSFRIR